MLHVGNLGYRPAAPVSRSAACSVPSRTGAGPDDRLTGVVLVSGASEAVALALTGLTSTVAVTAPALAVV